MKKFLKNKKKKNEKNEDKFSSDIQQDFIKPQINIWLNFPFSFLHALYQFKFIVPRLLSTTAIITITATVQSPSSSYCSWL